MTLEGQGRDEARLIPAQQMMVVPGDAQGLDLSQLLGGGRRRQLTDAEQAAQFQSQLPGDTPASKALSEALDLYRQGKDPASSMPLAEQGLRTARDLAMTGFESATKLYTSTAADPKVEAALHANEAAHVDLKTALDLVPESNRAQVQDFMRMYVGLGDDKKELKSSLAGELRNAGILDAVQAVQTSESNPDFVRMVKAQGGVEIAVRDLEHSVGFLTQGLKKVGRYMDAQAEEQAVGQFVMRLTPRGQQQ
jgi:hypothetical protein